MELRLQHIHLATKDKHALADWYCKNLGFVITDDLESQGELDGPILMTADRGKTSVSVFSRDKSTKNIFPAFECDMDTFLHYYANFKKPRIYDHYRFFSFYIFDPDHNKIEICITNYEEAKKHFNQTGVIFVLMSPDTYTE